MKEKHALLKLRGYSFIKMRALTLNLKAEILRLIESKSYCNVNLADN